MKPIFKYLCLAIGSVTAASVAPFYLSGTTAKSILECPPLSPHSPPLSVHDLLPDDIKVIAAIGDSVTAGMVAKNIKTTFISTEQFVEYRGSSWLMGGDKDANSIARYVKNYSPNVYGASRGYKPARLCPETFFCFDSHHDPEIDFLNAAQSGAISSQLLEQVDYLSERIGINTPYATTYKMINMFIGFNDASLACTSPFSVSEYKANITLTLNKLIDSVDYAFINLVGLMRYDQLIHLTDKMPGYKKSFQFNDIDMLDYECFCCDGPDSIAFIGGKVDEFNNALSEVAEELSNKLGATKKNIAVVFQPVNPVISTVPPNALSNADGYHPNVIGYKYMSRVLWNQMFRNKEDKVEHDRFDPEVPIYCPSVNDRFRTSQNKR